MKNKIFCVVAFTVFSSAILFNHKCIQAADDSKAFLDAIQAIGAQNKLAKALTISSNAKIENYNKQNQKWEFGNSWDVDAIFEATTNPRFNVVINKLVMPWDNGLSPYAMRVFSVAYNGQVSMTYTSKDGDVKDPANDSSGVIDGKRSFYYTPLAFATGWSFSNFGIGEYVSFSGGLTELLSQKDARLSEPSVPNQNDMNNHNEVLTFDNGKERLVIELDPKKNYSPVKLSRFCKLDIQNEKTRFNSNPTEISEIKEFSEPAPGFFYPKLIKTLTFEVSKDDKSVPMGRATIEVSKVILSQELPNDAYSLHFPANSLVRDNVSGKVIRVGGTPEQQKAKINRQADGVDKDTAAQ